MSKRGSEGYIVQAEELPGSQVRNVKISTLRIGCEVEEA
jgi:hypothetical protein